MLQACSTMFSHSLYQPRYHQLRQLKQIFPKILKLFKKGENIKSPLSKKEPSVDDDNDSCGISAADTVNKVGLTTCLANKNVVYVGGLSRISLECCKNLFAADVRSLCILEVESKQHLLQHVKTLDYGFVGQPIFLDLNDGQMAIESAVKQAWQRMGSIDVLINGADMVNEEFPRMCIDNNLLGPVYSTLAATPLMSRENGAAGGLIVNVSSIFGLEPASCLAVYSATQHGVIGFSRACAEESHHRKNGITHMTICIGLTDSELFNQFESLNTFDHSQPINDEIRYLHRQSIETCAEHMVAAIKTKENGSVWLINNGLLRRVEMPIYWKGQYEATSLKEATPKPPKGCIHSA